MKARERSECMRVRSPSYPHGQEVEPLLPYWSSQSYLPSLTVSPFFFSAFPILFLYISPSFLFFSQHTKFALDMRLIWRNCKLYNLYRSQIW